MGHLCEHFLVSRKTGVRTTPVTVLIASATRTISCPVNAENASLAVEMVLDFHPTTKLNAHTSQVGVIS